jgi:DNA-directed RNA polymerase specialized sigma24 family protein
VTTTDVRLTPAQADRLAERFREHNDFVVGLAIAQLRSDPAAAEDLAQTVWLSIIPTLAKGETIAHPRSFLATVVRRRAINYRVSAPVRRERAADWSDAVTSRALRSAAPADDDALAGG